MLKALTIALAPHGFTAKKIPGDELCDTCIEIVDGAGKATEIEVQIYVDRDARVTYYVNQWEGDGLATRYSGPDADRAVAAVLELLKVSA